MKIDKFLDWGVNWDLTGVLTDDLTDDLTDVKCNVFVSCNLHAREMLLSCVMQSTCQRDAAQLPRCMCCTLLAT